MSRILIVIYIVTNLQIAVTFGLVAEMYRLLSSMDKSIELSLVLKGRSTDTVQNCNSYINIPSSQTYKSEALSLQSACSVETSKFCRKFD
jgi:hypothetical protein